MVATAGRHLAGDGTLECVLQVVGDRHRASAPVHHDHVVELGDRRLLRLHVDRLDVQERVVDRDHEEIAEQDVRACLAQERPLAGEPRILVDPGEDLRGSLDRAPLGEPEHGELPVVRLVGRRRHPRHHVLAVGRNEGDHQLEFLRGRAGQSDQLVIRVDRHGGRAGSGERWVGRDRPEVPLLVEVDRVGHVVCGVLVRLHLEQVLRVAEMLL